MPSSKNENLILRNSLDSPKPFWAWVLASRPKTLSAAFCPILVASAWAHGGGSFQLWMSAVAFLSALFIQIGTNLLNDAHDFERGADTHNRLGPRRATQQGWLTAKQIKIGAFICFGMASLLGLPLVLSGGFPIALLGCFSLLAGYAYTGGPYPLAYIGGGELFVMSFFGWAAVCGMAYLQTGMVSLATWVAGSQIGSLSTLLLCINNYRDAETDVLVNKKTLVVRFGNLFGRMEMLFFLILPYLLSTFWLGTHYEAFLYPLLTLPLGIFLAGKLWTTPGGALHNQYLAQSALLQLLFSVALSLGLA